MTAVRSPCRLYDCLLAGAARSPGSTALSLGSRSLCYEELATESARLARVLLEEGLRKGDRVGIYMPKSLRSIVGLFGILGAGGVYVPIDPESPPQRVLYLLRDCGIRILLTVREKLALLSDAEAPLLDVAILCDGTPAAEGTDEKRVGPKSAPSRLVPWKRIEETPPLATPIQGVETDLAYILYTSGSTGNPKGVMISQRASLSFVEWARDEFGVSPHDVVSSQAPLHFDLSIFDIFTTLLAGGRVVLVPPSAMVFPVTVTQLMIESHLTIWYSTPSVLMLLLSRGQLATRRLPELRLLLFAGEVFPVKHLRVLRSVTAARFFNLYGPTETNVCTSYEVRDIPPDRTEHFPIGKAIPNYDVFAVDEAGRRIGPGEIGELCARGPGLMSGYWGDPEKTRRVLVPNWVNQDFEERVYRTGDLVTRDEDGNFLYQGRRDQMVKSRGHRIELGEIESAFHRHPAVREVAVVAIPDEEVTHRLKAFVVLDAGSASDAGALQAFCAQQLPRYMVPDAIEFRDSLPRTSSGKLDRRALVP